MKQDVEQDKIGSMDSFSWSKKYLNMKAKM